MMNAGFDPAASASASDASAGTVATASRAASATSSNNTVALQTASGAALLTAVRQDLHDSHATLKLAGFHFERTSDSTLEGSSKGLMLFDQAVSIPIVATVTYDIPLGRVERADYAISDSTGHTGGKPLAKELRERIADQIGARLVLEFPQQPVDFSLLAIDGLAQGTDRMVISGNGISRFPGEGAAYTRFTAVTDKISGRILTLKYELLQEVQPKSADFLARATN